MRRSSRALPSLAPEALQLIELGINHEQQHQELFLTDILATFAENPLEPAYGELPPPACFAVEPLSWHAGREGIVEIGASESGFAFDSERPRHRVFLAGARARRTGASPTRNGASSSTTAATADRRAVAVRRLGLGSAGAASTAPLYWRDEGNRVHPRRPSRDRLGGARSRTSASTRPTPSPAGPARGCRPRRSGKTFAASADPMIGNQLDAGRPGAAAPRRRRVRRRLGMDPERLRFLPRFRPAEGAVGEYNGKFMSGQMVLKGASCATPRGHSRASYRNFFPPSARWQFTGVRLARDA